MKKILISFITLITIFLLVGCDNNEKDINLSNLYQNDIYYSLFVRSFADSDGDGVGDLNGITENLDYLEELGITGIWLLPIFKSPSYHGYDTIDYFEIQEEYGTMDDLENLINKAKEKNINIILDLVINHTSDQHEWFIDASSGVNSDYRNYYVWNTESSAHSEFVGGMVDLNLSNDEVKSEIYKIVDFYMDLGIAGFRLDAVKHFFAGANEVGNDTLFMLELDSYIKNRNKNAYVVGEVWVNDYYILSNYYRSQSSYFNFYLQDELKDKVGRGNNTRLLVNNLEKMYNQYRSINYDFIDAPFLSNHDMDRIASMGEYQNVENLKLASKILMTLPGSPFIYYGDEIGLKGYRYEGDEIAGRVVYDEYRRQPFLWGNDYTTTWLASDGSNNNTKSLLEQKNDPNSIFNTNKEIINIRKNNNALMYGNEFYAYANNTNTLQGFVRAIKDEYLEEAVLVLINFGNEEIIVDYDLEYIYGSKVIPSKGLSIIKIAYDQIEAYS